MDMQVSAEYPTHGYEQPGLENQDAQLYLASNILPGKITTVDENL